MEKRFSIGVLLESFRLPMQQAVEQARKTGVQGVQAYVHNLTASQQKELYMILKDNGLKLSAVCGDLGHGFGDPKFNPDLIERSKRILDTAKELGTDIVTTHIGVVPANPHHPRYRAVETGPETAETLCAFLDSLRSTGVAVNLDPANLVMVTGDDPVKAVHTLKKYIVHTHAKDGRKLLDRDPEIIYHIVKPLEPVTDHAFIELPLGEGDVPFPAYLDALQEIGYKGFLTIEREVGANPTEDILKAADYLRQLI